MNIDADDDVLIPVGIEDSIHPLAGGCAKPCVRGMHATTSRTITIQAMHNEKCLSMRVDEPCILECSVQHEEMPEKDYFRVPLE